MTLGISTKDFDKGIDGAVSKSKSAGSSIVGSLSQVGGAVVTGAFVAAGSAAVALGGFLMTSVKAAADAQDIQAQLGAVLKSTGGAAGVTAKQVNDLATGFGNTTKFEDDAVVSGENMLLTFTNIGKNVFPLATQTMLDMAQAMGGDLPGTAIQLGKALNNPTEGMGALTRVGVTFTDAQKALIKSLQESGDMEGAQAVILKELQTEFGGAAKAAGDTFAGKLTILQNQFGNIQESIGGALLPMLTNLATTFSEKLADPAVQTWIANVTQGIVNFAKNAIDYIPTVIGWFKQVGSWFMDNQGVIVAILGTLGIAVAAFGVTTLISIGPIILIFGAIGLAIYLLYQAWTTNLGGMRDTLTAIWEGILKPIFNDLQAWLKVNLPIAIAWLANAWTTVLLPAITAVFSWIKDTLIPFLAGPFWSTVQSVAGFISTVLVGAFNGVASAINWVITAVHNVIAAINSIPKVSLPSVAGGAPMGGIPGKAAGGPVMAGQAYTVGEHGIETFVPNVSGNIIPHGGGIGGNSEIVDLLRQIAGKQEFDAQSLTRMFRDAIQQVMA